MSVGEIGSRQSNRVNLSGNISGTLAAAQMPALTGDVTNTAGSLATTISALAVTTGKINTSAVTYAKIQNESATTLLGNPTGSPAAPSEITLGTNLSFAGTVLNASGGSGTVSTVSVVSANGLAGSVANPTTTPAITLSTTITGILKGDGTSISAATLGTDYIRQSSFIIADMPTYSMYGGV